MNAAEPAARIDILRADPLPWLLESDEPWTRWLTLTGLQDRPAGDTAVVAVPGVRSSSSRRVSSRTTSIRTGG